MKIFSIPFTVFLIIIAMMLRVNTNNANAQTIVIDSTFTTEAEIFPFNQNDTIYGLGLSGSIKLNSDTSLIRIIFVDDDYNEFLVYEAYPYIVDDWDLEVLNEADETKYLGETNPNSISIHLIEDVILNIFPNPAGTFFIMEYDLRNYYGDMVVSICNINGIELDRFILQKFQNQLVVNTGNYSSGVYIIQIKVNEKILESKKVVISK